MTDVIIRRDTGLQRRMICEIEVEIEVLQLQTEEHLGLLADHQMRGRGKEGFTLQASEGEEPCGTMILDFSPPEL